MFDVLKCKVELKADGEVLLHMQNDEDYYKLYPIMYSFHKLSEEPAHTLYKADLIFYLGMIKYAKVDGVMLGNYRWTEYGTEYMMPTRIIFEHNSGRVMLTFDDPTQSKNIYSLMDRQGAVVEENNSYKLRG